MAQIPSNLICSAFLIIKCHEWGEGQVVQNRVCILVAQNSDTHNRKIGFAMVMVESGRDSLCAKFYLDNAEFN
mgnify:CR=1 FL=1